MSRRPTPFNNPFQDVKLRPPEKAQKAKPARRPEPTAEPTADEAALFREAVGEVRRVKRGPVVAEQAVAPRDLRIMDPEMEALAELAQLVAGERDLDLSDSDEFIEAAVPGLDPRVRVRLRKGEFAVQAHVDLHGLTRPEGKAALERFVDESRRKGHRCVLVVHGRGLHSKDQIPVLKESLQGWLAKGRIGRQVLAFTTARPTDGGAGAVYVLLRK
jgi:DNA-nicking Smr family endonuclease